MKFMITLMTTLLVLALSNIALAQGTAGFEILRVQAYPRGASLGGALVADSGHIESVYYNPAGLAGLSQRTAGLGYMNYLLDINSGYVVYAEPHGKVGTWSGSVIYTNYGDFDHRSETGEDLGSFKVNDWVIGLSYANTFMGRYSLGISGKFAYSKIENYVGTAAAFDLGGQMDLLPGRLRFGFGLYNVGVTTNAYAETSDDLPTYFRLGVTGSPTGLPADLYFSMTIFQDVAKNYSLKGFDGSDFGNFLGDISYSFGAEFKPMETFYVRLGYDTQGLNQRVGTRDDALAGISGGVGFDMTIARLDVGLASYGEMGLVTRSALSVAF
jgi:hypothetical protein